MFFPNLAKANLPTPFDPACTLTLLFESIKLYPLSLFPICIQCLFISFKSIPFPSSVIFNVLSMNSKVIVNALASYAFFTNSNTAASSVEKFCTPKSSAIVLSSIMYLRFSIFPPLKIKIFYIF